jgi:hypothetical protein
MALGNFAAWRRLSAIAAILFGMSVVLAGCANVKGNATTPPENAVSVAVSPTSAAVQVAGTKKFTATVSGTSNTAVTWQVNGTAGGDATHGTVDASGNYTAPAAVPSPAAVTVTAVSMADASKSGAATVTISGAAAAVSVSVAATTATVPVGTTASLTATVQNDSSNKGVTWALSGTGCTGAACGTLSAASSASGAAVTYTAPATVPTPATVTATATAVADTTKTATTVITITAAPAAIAVTISPTTASVQTGKTQAVTATVANDAANKGVTYTLSGTGCSGAACGTLSAGTGASGVAVTYTAPAAVPTPATVTVTATSVADTTKSAATVITITAAASGGTATVSISPKRVGLTTGQLQTFTATVTGNSNTAVTWEVDTIAGGNATVGTVSPAGVYTPPATGGTHTVGARSVADTTVVATASVAVTDLTGVFTYHNDLARDGVNSKEYALNTTTVAAATFGKQFSCAVDAQSYAQPLWVANVTIGSAKHNVVIAETMHNTIYAFDADASPCVTLWTKSLMASGETWLSNTDVNSTDISPDIGIVGTPVIDPTTSTIYVVSKSKNGSTVHQRLHALSVIDGSEKFAGPAEIAFSSGGFTFDPLRQNERCGLALVNGIVYVAWASHGDQGPYYGWIAGYNASTLALVSVYNDDPHASNQTNAGIWMSGGAPAADTINGTTSLYVITGNGPFDGVTYFGDSFLKLSTGASMTTSSFFTPNEQATLEANDRDLGSGGTAVLVDQPTTPNHLLIGGGKEGFMYVLNRDSLGGYTPTDSGTVQIISTNNGIFATPAFFQNTLYIGSAGGNVKAYTLTNGRFGSDISSQSPTAYNWPGATPSVSSQGTSNGIVWALERNGPAILHAYDATNLSKELWNSAAKSADTAGTYVKFTVPTVANGKVYVGTANEIDVYGLSPN